MPDEPKDRIEERKHELYSREGFKEISHSETLSPTEVEVSTGWQSNQTDTKTIFSTGMVKQIFFGSVLFFVLAIIAALFLFFNKSNVVSPDNIDVLVRGPVSVRGGETLNLEVTITNRNTVSIESADLIVYYPVGTRSAEDLTKEQGTFRKFLGEIAPGRTANVQLSSVLFGEERSEQNITLVLAYRTKGSNAIVEKNKNYPIVISSSPLNLTVTLPDEVSAKQEIALEVEVSSNATSELKDVLLEVKYPSGFTYKGATPLPVYRNQIWDLGDMPVGASRVITVRGTLDGEEEELKSFVVTAGLANTENGIQKVIPYTSLSRKVIIQKPFIALGTSLSGAVNADYVARPGERIRADINWANNTDSRIANGEITAKLNGNALDESSITVVRGIYQSIAKLVIWNKQTEATLGSMEPGAQGQVRFTIAPFGKTEFSGNRITNPEFSLEFVFKGTRVTESQTSEPIQATVTRRVKVASEASITSRAVYSVGPFVNTGPLPPKANNETSYTVIWSLANTTSDISNGEVRAILPAYMKWYGVVSPSTETVTYDANAGEIVWKVGAVKAGTGFFAPAREVAFQVGLLASVSQVGTYPTLVNVAKFKGTDTWTKGQVTAESGEPSTRITTDPAFQDKNAQVTP